jgi:hypothetical protein
MRLGPLVCGLLIIIIYLNDFLYFQQGLQSRPCRETPHIRCTRIMCALFCAYLCQSIAEIS